MKSFVIETIRTTMTNFTYDGVHQLDPSRAYLFISNHRDITLDSALLNYALVENGFESMEIAIGDNLLTNPLVADLLRLNKSFVVNRSATGLKEKYKALAELSHYMSSAMQADRSLWIAQREGRAKDGTDLTDPAILKMLHMWPKQHGMSFSEAMQQFQIVPVAIAYEYDPCDGLKARELQARQQPDYEKASGDDLQSIMWGISQQKGRVHIQLGQPLAGDYQTPEVAAAAIDQQILANYRLFPCNWVAMDALLQDADSAKLPVDLSIERLRQWLQSTLAQQKAGSQEFLRQAGVFKARLAEYSEQVQQYMLHMYANPVINKYRNL